MKKKCDFLKEKKMQMIKKRKKLLLFSLLGPKPSSRKKFFCYLPGHLPIYAPNYQPGYPSGYLMLPNLTNQFIKLFDGGL